MQEKKNRQDFYENHINHIFGAFLKSLDLRDPSEYDKKIKRPGIGRFVKSTLFEKCIFLNINKTYQK